MFRMLTTTLAVALLSIGAGIPVKAADSAVGIGSAAANAATPMTDLSTQRRRDQGGQATPQHRQRTAPHGRAAPRPMAPRMAPRTVGPQRVAPRHTGPRRVAPRYTGPRRVAPVQRPATRIGPQRQLAPRVVRPVNPRRTTPRIVGPSLQQRVGPRLGARIGSPLRFGGRRVNVIRGRHRAHWRGRAYWALPLTVLSALAIGSLTYTPFGYVPVDEDYCYGWTADGCRLRWTWVPTLEGDEIPQCVAYCPF
jgi:hypothetical protein